MSIPNLAVSLHGVLTQEVDGSAADDFVRQLAGADSDIQSIHLRYDEPTQVRWLAGYWIDQLIAMQANNTMVGATVSRLTTCNNGQELMVCFLESVLPIVHQIGIPNPQMAMRPVHDFMPNRMAS